MIWIILIGITIVVSLILTLRSMKDYHDVPSSKEENGLFLIRNRQGLSSNKLDKVHSLERFFKGKEDALILYGPKSLMQSLPELNLLELEDPLGSQVKPDDAFAWVIQPKDSAVQKTGNINKVIFFNELDLEEDQIFFWQIVFSPEGYEFQSTIRGIIVDQSPHQRVLLSKLIDQKLKEETGLVREERRETTTQIFNAFKKRTLLPKETTKFTLSAKEILNLLGI